MISRKLRGEEINNPDETSGQNGEVIFSLIYLPAEGRGVKNEHSLATQMMNNTESFPYAAEKEQASWVGYLLRHP